MAVVRRAELDCACQAIGFSTRYDLGYVDSGWHEDHATVPDGTFGRCDVEEAASALAAILRTERPQVVVTYPEDGGYPHPDHVMVHTVSMRAVAIAAYPASKVAGDPWQVSRVFACEHFTRDRVRLLHQGTVARGLPSPFEGWEESRDRPDPAIHARVEVGDWFDRRDAALRCHASQVDPDGFWFQVPRDLERELFPWDLYALLRPEPGDQREWDDLFEGLGA